MTGASNSAGNCYVIALRTANRVIEAERLWTKIAPTYPRVYGPEYRLNKDVPFLQDSKEQCIVINYQDELKCFQAL